ncbi:MAG: DUF1249 domain-containing protein [Gammaproteobacteria bacterium]|nr:DUF1249 domain-containing protein [Gammaproteobacteria bacterium]
MVPQLVIRDSESPSGCSFAGLMELYENNYIFLRRLIPQLDHGDDVMVSSISHGPDLHLAIEERCAYTTTLALTHQFAEVLAPETLPNLRLRIYHDARVAEVMPHSAPEGFAGGSIRPTSGMGTLAWRWQVNRFLQRWLRYCLGEGYGFPVEFDDRVTLRPPARRWAV